MNIDVIIPNYNHSIYLIDSIKSCVLQGISTKNIYVVDDNSSDNPEKILEKFSINFIKNEKNLGPAASRNIGIKNSKSKYIAFLDSDDIMLPDRLKNSISILDSGAKMVCGNYKFLINRKFITNNFYKNPINIEYYNLFKTNLVACGSVSLNRSVLDDVGLFNEDYRLAEDYDLWLRISEKYKIEYIHKPLYLYSRINNSSLTSNPNNLNTLISNIEKIKELSKKRIKN
jgi:glycosyltransferase involved in cell wall biosynthesis